MGFICWWVSECVGLFVTLKFRERRKTSAHTYTHAHTHITSTHVRMQKYRSGAQKPLFSERMEWNLFGSALHADADRCRCSGTGAIGSLAYFHFSKFLFFALRSSVFAVFWWFYCRFLLSCYCYCLLYIFISQLAMFLSGFLEFALSVACVLSILFLYTLISSLFPSSFLLFFQLCFAFYT